MLKKMILLFLLGVFVLNAQAGTPSVKAVKAGETPVLDGLLNDDCWSKAEWQTGFLKTGTTQKASQQTKFKVLYDDSGIYFAIRCDDSDIQAKARPRDSAVWHDDCVEIFVVPRSTVSSDPNIREVYQFIINASGSKFDSFITGNIGNSNWNTRWKAATAKRPHGWNAEVFLPFSCFDIKSNDSVWRFNISRENRGKNVELSTWSFLHKFSDSPKYGELKGLETDFGRYKISLSKLQVNNMVINGKASPIIAFELKDAPSEDISIRCSVSEKGKLVDFTGIETVKLDKFGTTLIKVPLLRINKSGEYLIKLIFADAKGIVYYSEFAKHISFAPMKIVMKKPFYRNNIYSLQTDKSISLNCSISLAPEDLKQHQLVFELQNSEGKTFKKQNITSLEAVNHFNFDASTLKSGEYKIEVTLIKNKKKILSLFQTVNILAPAEGNEIWLNSQRQLVINNKIFFVNGFMAGSLSTRELSLLKNNGFNVIHSYILHKCSIDEILKKLDEVHKYGQKVILRPLCGRYGFGKTGKSRLTPDIIQEMLNFVNMIKKHPAVLGWYLYDEPRAGSFCLELKRFYHILRKADPYHPVIGLDNTSGGCIAKQGYCDIHSLDLYPSPIRNVGNRIPISTLYASVEKMYKELTKEGIWYTSQAFSRESFKPGENHRSPNYREIRCAEYSAIVAGATGLLRYKIGNPASRQGRNSGVYHSPEMEIGFLEGMGPEINCMRDVLLSETLSGQISSSNSKIKLLVKRYSGNIFVMAVNPTPKNIGKVTLKTPLMKSNKIKVLFENRTLDKDKNTIADDFPAFAVHVYTDKLDFKEPININDIQHKIKQARELKR